MSTQQNQSNKRPWGFLAATLMGSFITLIGVVRGLDPSLVLQRVLISAVVTGFIVSWTVRTMTAILPARGMSASKGRT